MTPILLVPVLGPAREQELASWPGGTAGLWKERGLNTRQLFPPGGAERVQGEQEEWEAEK